MVQPLMSRLLQPKGAKSEEEIAGNYFFTAKCGVQAHSKDKQKISPLCHSQLNNFQASQDHFNFGFEIDGDGNSSGVVHARDIVGSHEGAVVGAVGSSKELLQTTLD